MKPKPRVLFLCTGNSCRSQMAEGWARALKGDVWDVFSAGTRPQGLNPRAVKAMAEAGVDIAGQRSKSVEEYRGEPFDVVVTVCGDAREHCPTFPGKAHRVHAGFDDPPRLAAGAASEEEAMAPYRRVRDEIKAFVLGFSAPPSTRREGVKRPSPKAGIWGCLYALGVAGATAAVMTSAGLPGRGLLYDLGVAAGAVAFFVFVLQFFLTARFLPLGRSVGVDAELRFHRWLGLTGTLFVVLHAAMLLWAAPQNWGYLNWGLGLPGGAALYVVLVGLGLLALLSLGRRALGIPYDLWRLTHGLLAATVVALGAAHMVTVGYLTSGGFNRAIVFAAAGVALTGLAHIRLVKPLLALRRPWVVAEVRYEGPKTWTLAVQALNHNGLRFAPGQYAWLTLGRNPFRLEQHPFTIASSAERNDRLEFVIKELGDFTSKMASVAPDTTAYVEGPYGGMPGDGARGVVFLAGGVGISPALSMLRTMKDRKDRRPFVLFYAAASAEKLAFREELEKLRGELDLTNVFVVETAAPGWTGESGYITQETLDRRLPREGRNDFDYLICGPDPMIERMHEHLTALGVPRRRQRSERFNWV